ncbi:hypothetical protein [Mesorhizobium qingshengii]|uniref:hypothetical protein n=1 Tax=Mesorhizobium qingshengii TaxID=1165689 RepID=UPI000A50CE75|nr:hypothetical protein [Mesorhizobium qingshengii]
MPEAPKDKDQEKGDEVLRRLLKTPPKPHSDSTLTPSKRERTQRTLGSQKTTDKDRE